jgi:hypothetical protein
MHRQCDDCKGIFKIPSKLEKYFLKKWDTGIRFNIFCPYCNNVSSHEYTRQYPREIIESKRGIII